MRPPPPSSLRRKAFQTLAALALAATAGACASGGRYAGMTPAEIHALGQREFDQGDYGDAIQALDRLILVYPDYAQIAEARFLLARAYQADAQYLLASDEYLRFLERHSGHPLMGEAALGVCRSYVALSPIPPRDQTYTLQAYNVCRDVARDYAAFPVASEAAVLATEMRAKLAQKEYANAEHWYRRRAYDSAIIYWEMLVSDFSDTEWAPRALAGIHCAWQRIGYEDDAEEARLRLLASYPESDEARRARDGGLDC